MKHNIVSGLVAILVTTTARAQTKEEIVLSNHHSLAISQAFVNDVFTYAGDNALNKSKLVAGRHWSSALYGKKAGGRYNPNDKSRLVDIDDVNRAFEYDTIKWVTSVNVHESMHAAFDAGLFDTVAFTRAYVDMERKNYPIISVVKERLEQYDLKKTDIINEQIAHLGEQWVMNGYEVTTDMQKALNRVIDANNIPIAHANFDLTMRKLGIVVPSLIHQQTNPQEPKNMTIQKKPKTRTPHVPNESALSAAVCLGLVGAYVFLRKKYL